MTVNFLIWKEGTVVSPWCVNLAQQNSFPEFPSLYISSKWAIRDISLQDLEDRSEVEVISFFRMEGWSTPCHLSTVSPHWHGQQVGLQGLRLFLDTFPASLTPGPVVFRTMMKGVASSAEHPCYQGWRSFQHVLINSSSCLLIPVWVCWF